MDGQEVNGSQAGESIAGRELANAKTRLLVDVATCGLAIAGAVTLGGVAAAAGSTAVMCLAIFGATILGGIGVIKAFSSGMVLAAIGALAIQKEQSLKTTNAGPASLQSVEPDLVEVSIAKHSSKVDRLNDERKWQTLGAGKSNTR
jgi:hypothetical protein